MNLDLPSVLTILISGICTGGVYGLFASSFTFQIGSLDTPDFSFGAWLMLSMYLTFFLQRIWNVGALIFVLIPVYFGIGYLINRYLLAKQNIFVKMLITMGISFIIQNLVILVFTAFPRNLGIIDKAITFGNGIQVGMIKLGMLVLSAFLLIGFQIFINKTWMGKTIRAIIQQKEAAYLMGINADKIKNIAFGLSYVMVSISGFMLLILFSVEPTAGGFYQMMSFLICIIAGLGNLRGAFYSGLLTGTMIGVLNIFIAQYAMVALFLIFVIILVVKPKGLFTVRQTK